MLIVVTANLEATYASTVSNPITDRRVNDVLIGYTPGPAGSCRGLPSICLGALKGLVGAKPSNDSDAKYVATN